MKRLYVVWDVVAQAVASAVLIYAGDPAAIRGFSDALADPQSPYAKHAADFELRMIGVLTEEPTGPLVSVWESSAVVLTGAQWLAMQAKQPELVKEA